MTAIRGRVGGVVFRTYGRKIVVSRVPSFDGYVPSAAQRTRRERLREATAFAQRVYADPAAKAFYVAAAKKLGRQPFRLAVSDHLRRHARLPLDFSPAPAPRAFSTAMLADHLVASLESGASKRPTREAQVPTSHSQQFDTEWARFNAGERKLLSCRPAPGSCSRNADEDHPVHPKCRSRKSESILYSRYPTFSRGRNMLQKMSSTASSLASRRLFLEPPLTFGK